MQLWDAKIPVSLEVNDGTEFFVIEAGFLEGDDTFVQHRWLGVPIG